MSRRRVLRSMIGLTVLWPIGMLAGCGGGGGAGGLGPAPAIVVDGSSTVYRISMAARDSFNLIEPSTVIVVDYHGTGAGFSRYMEGEIDFVDASRAAKPGEESKAKAQGIDWTRFLVGYDGITLVVNPKNDFVKSLSVEQLKTLWEPASKIMSWKDIDPAWPNRKIILYSPDDDSGTFEFFTEAIVGKSKSQREDVQMSSDDNFLVHGVSNDTDGLGYFGYAYFAAHKDSLRAVPLQNGASAPAVLPSPATIIDKSYAPLSRPLYIYVKNSAARRGEVGRFLKHYLDKIDQFAVEGGYAPPTAEDKTANQATLAKLLPAAESAAETKTPSSK
jgi:phosphate transport system substrate-binding protein